MSKLAKKLKRDNLFPEGGKVLDLGSGDGRHSLQLSKDAVLVDKKFGHDMRTYPIKTKYDVVLCNNALTFLDNKKEVKDLVDKVMNHLKKNGVFVFTLWMPNHAWAKSRLTHTDDELNDLVKDYFTYYKEEIEGIVTVMDGSKKYWHSREFWLMNK